MKMKAVTGDLCWVASSLLQLRIAPTLSSSSSQLVFFFPHKSFGSRSEKSPKCMPAKSLILAGICYKKKGTVRTAKTVHGSQNREV